MVAVFGLMALSGALPASSDRYSLGLGCTRPWSPTPAPPHKRSSKAGSAAAYESINMTSRVNTQFGIGYEVWWQTLVSWSSPEAQPVLGKYSSLDPSVIAQHAAWITGAGIDFIMVDLSNSLSEVALSGLDELLKVYATLDSHPKVTILLSTFTNGTLEQKAELVKTRYMSNATYNSMFLQYKGKPLLTYFTGPTFSLPPDYTNPDYTVRFMGAFQEITLNPAGTWSWVNRQPIVDGTVSNISGFSASGFQGWNADPAWHLADGLYASSEPAANGTQQSGNITSPPFTITADFIQFNSIGTDEFAQAGLKQEDTRNIFLLEDADTGEILKSASPPGSTTTFFLRQWNVRSLKGREVIFRAVNNGNSAPSGLGWFAFYGLQQLENEFMTSAASTSGNEFYGADADWDSHFRYYGATLVYNMQAVFDSEPDIALVQQWNEFGSPDQYSVEASNDMEPTEVTKLAGAWSDGWGYYYLNLTTELIRQYRQGSSFPAVMLDTRYP